MLGVRRCTACYVVTTYVCGTYRESARAHAHSLCSYARTCVHVQCAYVSRGRGLRGRSCTVQHQLWSVLRRPNQRAYGEYTRVLRVRVPAHRAARTRANQCALERVRPPSNTVCSAVKASLDQCPSPRPVRAISTPVHASNK